jgi:hypothetical protein
MDALPMRHCPPSIPRVTFISWPQDHLTSPIARRLHAAGDPIILTTFTLVKRVRVGSQLDRALAQVVQVSTAATRVRPRVRSCGICGEQSGTGADFFRVLRLPLPILIPHSSSITWGWYNRPVSGRHINWT